MDWLKEPNDALTCLEAHLDGDIDLEQAARLARCSSFHFQRMFSYMAGATLSEHLRRRRMTRAAFDLQNGDGKVIDIALRYGYDSPTAFNRAFQAIHGVPPSAARQEGVLLKAYHPISFQISICRFVFRPETRRRFQLMLKSPSGFRTARGYCANAFL